MATRKTQVELLEEKKAAEAKAASEEAKKEEAE